MPKSVHFPHKLLLLLSISLPLISAQASDVPLSGPIPFEAFDKNGDKMISPQEYVEAHNMRKKLRADAKMPESRMMEPGFNYFDVRIIQCTINIDVTIIGRNSITSNK